MKSLENIEFGTLIYSGILRDGGSAVLIIDMTSHKMRLRVMRSISEQSSDLFNFIEICIDESKDGHAKSKNEIIGLGSVEIHRELMTAAVR